MKKTTLFILISLTSILSFAAPRFTADYYELEADKFDGKDVTLYLSSARISDYDSYKKEGYIRFSCSTYYKESGGYAYIYVPEAKAKSFSKIYGNLKVRTKADYSYNSIPTKSYKVKLEKEKGKIHFIGY